MRISVEIAFSFKREIGADYRSLELPDGATIRDAVAEIARRYPAIRERLLAEDGAIRRNIDTLVNGGNARFRQRFETTLRDGDRLTILPPVGGG